jgi:trk system potassium uptake protein TrkH
MDRQYSMKSSTRLNDIRIIIYFSGKILIGLSILYWIPIITSLISGEYKVVFDFLISFGLMLSIGAGLILLGKAVKRPSWMHGMVTAAASWIMAMIIAALPYWRSGHYLSYLDCMFDVMSGLTTTGLVLIQDLDHISNGLNMWRHLLTFVGGQGIVVLALAIFVDGTGGNYGFYVGEGKDERLFPSVTHTVKTIWRISLLYLAIGTAALWIAGIAIGLSPGRAFLHGLWIYMAAWSTGGFAPMSQNVLYYHSAIYEILTFLFFMVGSFNFALHSAVIRGNRKELFRNIETLSFGTTLTILSFVVGWALMKLKVYPGIIMLIRKGYYQLASAHTTTGFMTIYPSQFANEWGNVALFALVVAMLIGGSACSTAGGFKGLRIGILFKAIIQDTKRLLNPTSVMSIAKFHYHGERSLGDQQVRSAASIVLLYLAMFTVAVLATCAAGYPFIESVFEVSSVTGNVGLTIGITSPSMPVALKYIYIFVMWAGRLEFMAILASVGFAASLFRKRKQ